MSSTTPVRILVLEDDPAHGEAIRREFKQAGTHFTVVLAGTVEQFFQEKNRAVPALVIADIRLPDGDVFDVFARLGEMRDFPVLVMTSFGDEATAVRAMKAGAADYIAKSSATFHELPRLAEKALREWEQLKEREILQTSLLESREKFRSYVDNAPDGIFVVDETGKYVEANPAACKISGYTEEELRARSIMDLLAPQSRETGAAIFAGLLATGAAKGEIVCRHKNGSDRWWSLDAVKLSDSRYMGFSKDITERKTIEAAQEFLLRCGFQNSDDNFFESLARFLGETLGIYYVSIDRLLGDNLTAQTVAVYCNGKIEDNLEYALRDTPCGSLVGQIICCFPRNVCALFPNDPDLQELGADSYLGSTLWGFDGRPIGLIALINREPMKNIQLAEAILKLVSIRAAGELERQKDLKFLQRNAEIQTVMRQISEAALWDSSLDEFFAAVHRLIGTVLPAENFQIALVDELSGIIVDRFIVDSILTGLQQRPIGTGLTEYTLRQERAVHITQAELLRLRESGEVTRQPRAPIHEWLGVPLVGPTGKGVGIMALIARKADQSFLPEDTGLLSLIAAPVSLAIERKRAEATLASSESRLSRAQAIAHVGNWEIELPTMQVTASVEAFQIYGLEPDTTCLHLQAIQQIVRREDRSRLDRALKGLLDRNEKYDVEFGINRADNGLEKLIHSIAELECDQDGKPKKIIGVIQDITEMKQVEQTLIESEARYRAVMEQAPEAMLLCDPDTWDVVEANSRFTALFGYDLQEKEPLNLIALFVDEPAKIREYIDRLIQTGNLALQRRVCRHRNGSAITVERTATLVKYRGRRLFVMTLRDMSETLRREQAEHHQATHDELTGLYNRRGFGEAVAKKLAEGRKGGALLLVGIDDFRLINDIHGHIAGDKYLAAFGRHLNENYGASALIARFGGDEFILFFDGPEGFSEASRVSESMEVICLETETGSFFVQLSGGISLLDEQELQLDLQIQRAYLAMHHAKESGKWCCKTYESALHDSVNRRYAVKEALNHALANGEFRLVYQPIFDIQETPEKIIGYEALLRWTNPELGELTPAEFIPAAEETNMILPIGKWVLQEACRFSVNIRKARGEYVNVAVNISMRQLALPNFVNMVREILQETGLPARYLSLEVTESILMTDAATKISYLEALRDVGVAISLDDFGTGYSSFTYLAQMPITTLKIDKSMVDDIAQRGNSRNLLLLEALLQLSVLLGYRVVAEGVETREQLNLLKSKGCGFCQGYLLGRPMPEAAVLAMGGQQTK